MFKGAYAVVSWRFEHVSVTVSGCNPSFCVPTGLAPVLVHMAKDSSGKFAFNPVSVNLLVELAKTLFALVTLGTGRPGPPMYRSMRSFAKDAAHNRLLAVPAALYAVNNYLKFGMQLYFKPTTAKMLSNMKILVIALLMRSVMRRTFSIFQWEALLLLVGGVTVNQLNYCTKEASGDVFSAAAIMYTIGSITVPSLASVYNEFALKKHMDTSVLLQNFFLYFFGMCFNLAGLSIFWLLGAITPATMFAGFRQVVVLLVLNNALQGILSSFFFKYADTILKKYSSTIATIFTGLMSAGFFGHQLTLNFCIGVTIVFISMHLFFSTGGTKGKELRPSKMAVSPSMDHMNLVPGDSAASSRVMSSTELAAAAAPAEAAPLLGHVGDAAARRLLPR
ncbi:hypothetical protein N2152v2_005506 [Parachlorella kessleri]